MNRRKIITGGTLLLAVLAAGVFLLLPALRQPVTAWVLPDDSQLRLLKATTGTNHVFNQRSYIDAPENTQFPRKLLLIHPLWAEEPAWKIILSLKRKQGLMAADAVSNPPGTCTVEFAFKPVTVPARAATDQKSNRPDVPPH